jgi:hypothetical protein
MHGGTNPGGYRGQPVGPMNASRALKQALFKRLGLPWYGGRLPKAARVMEKMEKSLVVAEAMLERDEVVDGEGLVLLPSDGHSQLLDEGSRDGLMLQRDTIRMARGQMLDAQANAAPLDYKLLRLGNDAANALNRLAVRVAEGQFRVRRDDVLATLLEKLTKKENAP